MKIMHRFKYVFLCLYLVYAVSPMMADTEDSAPLNGVTSERESPVIKILLWDRLLAGLLQQGESREPGDNDIGSDFLVRKFRSLPADHSLGKRIFAETHASTPCDISTADNLCSAQYVPYLAATSDHLRIPFQGYGTLHSGPAPPFFLA